MTQRDHPNDTTPQNRFRVIGTRPPRLDGSKIVTGRARFGADIQLSDMLVGKVLRSPHAHAWIRAIDTSRAEALPGVRAVVTATDLPPSDDETPPHLRYQRDNILAREKVRYDGHAIAAVAATSSEIAAEAVMLIKVDYEVLSPVVDVREAMQDGAPILHNDLRTDDLGQRGDKPTNVAMHMQIARGDISVGFEASDVIVEREFVTSMVHQGYLEPQNATALFESGDQLTIWCSTQGAFDVRRQVAEILNLPQSSIRVIPMAIGGAFGGKYWVYLEPVAALLSRRSGQPVQMAMSRAEVFAGTGPSPGLYIRARVGADALGRITAAEACLVYEAGAFPGSTVGSGVRIIFAPYRIANLQIEGYDVVTNKPKTGSYRGMGSTVATYASEAVIDELCEKLGMDPLEFRLLNGVQEDDCWPDGSPFPRIGYLETVRAARNHPHYTALLEGPNQGRGIASAVWFNWGGCSSATATVNADGTVSLWTGSVDLSGTRTTLAMQLAEALGIPVDDVRPEIADTDTVDSSEGSYGSRTTFATGWAVYELGQQIKSELVGYVAQVLEVEPDSVVFKDGVFFTPERQISFKALAAWLAETNKPVSISVTVQPEEYGPGAAVHMVDVEVDPETGRVHVLRYTAVQDVGKAIHPTLVEGQIQGGVVQGIGWALHEGYLYDDDGQLLNGSFAGYHLPTCLDVPPVEPVLVEVPNPGHPYGVRGAGEIPILPVPAAVANAIYQAIGVRLTKLPMSPATVLGLD